MMKICDIKKVDGIRPEVFEYMNLKKHEKVVFCSDPESKLNAIIAIHNTITYLQGIFKIFNV